MLFVLPVVSNLHSDKLLVDKHELSGQLHIVVRIRVPHIINTPSHIWDKRSFFSVYNHIVRSILCLILTFFLWFLINIPISIRISIKNGINIIIAIPHFILSITPMIIIICGFILGSINCTCGTLFLSILLALDKCTI